MLEDTKLSTVLDPNMLLKIERLGEVVRFGPGEQVFELNDEPDYLYINLRGNIYLASKEREIWIGPGDILGEIGYIMGTPRTVPARAGDEGCTAWRTHRRYLADDSLAEFPVLTTHLLLGLAPYIQLRYLTVTYRHIPDPTLGDEHCDHDHPAIRKVAHCLQGADDWASAVNVWSFVRTLPYRFGFWDVRASQTLELGFGMCTTKANLQVALLRALSIEARFGECEVAAQYLIPFLPEAYRGMITRNIKHYFAIVTLDGKPRRSDASFTREALQVLVRSHPDYEFVLFDQFRKDHEFFLEKDGDETQYKVFDSLRHVMSKRPFYDAENAEAMNILLDKHQGSVRPMPPWGASTRNLLSHDPAAARMKAMAGLICDLTRLYQAIDEREKGDGSPKSL